LRKFKNIEKARPLNYGAPKGIKEEDIIVNACESTPLNEPLQPYFNAKLSDTFWLKETPYSLRDMLGEGIHNKGYA
jgi:hypothetical protein